MSIQLQTAMQLPQTITYGASGAYESSFSFQTFDLSLSSVSAFNVTSLTLGHSASNPKVAFDLVGAALPRLLLVDETGASEAITYTFTGDNNFLHASTMFANITSLVVATAELSAGTETDDTLEVSGSFEAGLLTFAPDAAAPSPVDTVTITGINKVVALTWNNPVDADWTTTYVKQSTTAAVTTTAMGTLVYTATTPTMSAYTLNVPASGETYYYGIYTKDNVDKLSTIVNASVTPTNALPSPVTAFTAVGGDKVINLTWTNATDEDWVSTSVKMSTVAAITAVGDGTLVYTATAASMSAVAISVPVTGSEVYYFGAYSTDNVGGNSTIVTATPVASALPTWGVWASLAEHSRLYVEGVF